MSTALHLLTQIAPDYGGTCVQSHNLAGILKLPVQLVDGRTIPYVLELRDFDGIVSVREEISEHLPPFCPERHINSDSTFCLNYSPVHSLKIEDEATARVWMETVYKFLKLQERAKGLRKWPNDKAWAHGNAARHQMRVQAAVKVLGKNLAKAQSSRLLTVRRRHSKGRAILELLHNGECLYRVWEATKKVANQSRKCLCGISGRRRPKALRKCLDHGAQAVELVLALHEWDLEEKRYWDTMQNKMCCRTCDNCPLASSSSGAASDLTAIHETNFL